jgi:hypothetical protein
MLLDRLREYLEPSCASQAGDGPQSSVDWRDPRPCLFSVHWPTVHADADFRDDVVYFAVDEGWARMAPPGAVTYTLSELAVLKDLSPSAIRLIHTAKRMGGIVLEADEVATGYLLDAAKDVSATPVGS